MTVFTDNAAGRLHNLIILFRRYANQGTVPQAWATVLGIAPVEDPNLLRRLAHVFRLPSEIEAEIHQVAEQEFDSDLAMRWQVTIPGGLGPSLFTGQQSAQVASKFDDASLSSLEHCSYVLHRYRPQRMFADDEVERIRTLITDLKEEVTGDTGLDPDLRKFLLFHAAAMADALDDIPVRGSVGLEEAFDQAVGATQRRADLAVKSDSSPSAWRKFGNLIIAVAAMLQIATSSLMLPAQIRQEIEGPPPASPLVVKVIEQPAVAPDSPAQHAERSGERG